jgi:hypothetical protein
MDKLSCDIHTNILEFSDYKSLENIAVTSKKYNEYVTPIRKEYISNMQSQQTDKFINTQYQVPSLWSGGGGLMRIVGHGVSHGAQDVFLKSNPQITFFKTVYRRHTNFLYEKNNDDYKLIKITQNIIN